MNGTNAVTTALGPSEVTELAPRQPSIDWNTAGAPRGPDTPSPLVRYFAAVRRYKWLAVAIVLVGIAAGVIATRFIRPLYVVNSTLWIENDAGARGSDKQGPIRAGGLLASSQWIELFKSFAVTDPVVRAMRLYLKPNSASDSVIFRNFDLAERFRPGKYRLEVNPGLKKYTLATDGGVTVDQGVLGDSIGRALGFRWLPTTSLLARRKKVDFDVLTPREASVELRDKLVTNLALNSNFIWLTLKGEDPGKTAMTMNLWTKQFLSTAGDLKKRNMSEFSSILGEQLGVAQSTLHKAEMDLENFRVNTITLPSEGTPVAAGLEATRDPVFQSFFNQKIEYENVKRDREALEALLTGGGVGKRSLADALAAVPAALEGSENLRTAITELHQKEAQLRTMKQFYTDEYKGVADLERNVRVLDQETIPGLARGVLDRLRLREEELSRRIGTASTELRDIPTRTIEEMRLRRNVQVAENLYTALQMRYEEARFQEASAIPDTRLLDSAVAPLKPTKNTAPMIILGATGASIALAVLLAILLDRLDSRFRYPEQATTELGLEIVGFIPRIRLKRDGTPDMLEAAQVIEAFRSIRLNVTHAYADRPPFLLTITSPGASEGKSLIALNLAMSFAEAGYRTVLIDGDIRRGALHATFNVGSSPGLLDHLSGHAPIEAVTYPSSHHNLSIIPRGTRQRSGPELLAAPVMGKMLTQLKDRYDVVIVDSAPLGAGIDAFALGVATGNVLTVLRAGASDRKMAQAKLMTMDRLPVRILGAVLNDIRAEGVYQYYSYLHGYEMIASEDASSRAIAAGTTT